MSTTKDISSTEQQAVQHRAQAGPLRPAVRRDLRQPDGGVHRQGEQAGIDTVGVGETVLAGDQHAGDQRPDHLADVASSEGQGVGRRHQLDRHDPGDDGTPCRGGDGEEA
jgi:hypothetical protein